MTMYTTTDFPSKAALKRALAEGAQIGVVEKTPWGDKTIESGSVTLSGPHYPKPHKWYATAEVENGYLVSGTIR